MLVLDNLQQNIYKIINGIRDCTLSMYEGGPEGFCGGHEVF